MELTILPHAYVLPRSQKGTCCLRPLMAGLRQHVPFWLRGRTYACGRMVSSMTDCFPRAAASRHTSSTSRRRACCSIWARARNARRHAHQLDTELQAGVVPIAPGEFRPIVDGKQVRHAEWQVVVRGAEVAPRMVLRQNGIQQAVHDAAVGGRIK